MFMLSLMQPSGLYELEKDSLEAISAQLLQMIRMKSYELYTHSINVANHSVSIAAKTRATGQRNRTKSDMAHYCTTWVLL